MMDIWKLIKLFQFRTSFISKKDNKNNDLMFPSPLFQPIHISASGLKALIVGERVKPIRPNIL